MRRLALILLAILALAGCVKGRKDARLMAQVEAKHGCSKVRVIASGPWWRKLDVCGVPRFYEYGTWCEDCSLTWRERKAKP